MPMPPVSNITNAELAALLQVIGALMEEQAAPLGAVLRDDSRAAIESALFFRHRIQPGRARELAGISYDQLARLMTMPPEDSGMAPLMELPAAPAGPAANDPDAPKGGK